MQGGIAVIDFGSQLTQLIARRLREIGFYTEIFPYNVELEKLKEFSPKGIVLSGGPSSVYEKGAPHRDIKELYDLAPLLGICYGMQIMTHAFGGVVEPSTEREYGDNTVDWTETWGDYPTKQNVWMSHGDIVKVPPPGFKILAKSSGGHPAAMAGERAWAIQFHPEVSHTEKGTEILRAFAEKLCGAKKNWNTKSIAEHLLEQIKSQVPKDEHVLCALSGGVDSTVVGFLLTKALGPERVHCVFVDNALLRKDEFKTVLEKYKGAGLNVRGVNAADIFLKNLSGVEDPEKKRKIIGNTFIDVFEKCIPADRPIKWLAQGTLYPDVIESVSPRGASVTIKSHHNVGGLPEKMNLKLLEPLRELFKDEVRAIGAELGIPKDMLWRHPFPGPGLAIRIIGEVNKENLEVLKECDSLFVESLKSEGIYDKIWQAFCVLLPIKTVGVQGDGRTYEKVLSLRAVTSHDGMTADWYPFEYSYLRRISNRITNQVKGVNRVVYDITSKPPGTIEWE